LRRSRDIARELRVNEMIRIREVRIIDDEGQQLGVMPTFQALALAQEKGLDLVEVAPTAVPPVCRILDYGQYRYELQKREREQKKRQKSQSFKEVRLAVKIDTHDLQTKARRAAEFLDKGDRVKVTVRFRGREISHANLGRDLLMKVAEQLEEHGVVERPPLLEGKSMYIVMGPVEKRPERRGEAGEAGDAEPVNGERQAAGGGNTIGDAVAAKGQAPVIGATAPAAVETPAQQGS
jgi:translation initiation factor IF-3